MTTLRARYSSVLLAGSILLLATPLTPVGWASGRPGRRVAVESKQRPAPGGATRNRLRQAVRLKHPTSGLEVSGSQELLGLESILERIAAARRQPPRPARLHQGRKLEPGVQLPGADLRKVVWQGVDLREANLRRADLRGAWLVDARLDGADLTGACLENAILEGASLDGAKLFDSTTVGAVGLDSSRALSHPFFAPEAGEAAGQVRYLNLGSADREVFAPRCPTPSADGRLYWIGGSREELHAIFRHGARFEMPHQAVRGTGLRNGLLYTLVRDAQGAIWFFGDQVAGNIQPQEQKAVRGERELVVNHIGCSMPLAPFSATPAPGQGVDLTFPEFIAACDWQAGRGQIAVTPVPEGAAFLASCRNRTGTLEVTALEGAGGLRLSRPGSARAWPVELPAGAILQSMAAGPEDSVWVALSGIDALLALGPEPGQERLFRLPLAAHGRTDLPGVFAPSLGPDGNLWYTRPAHQRIGRCTPDGDIHEFALGPDASPLEIVPADDGTLLFTLLGRNRIGSIRAAARPEGAAPAPVPGDGKAAVPAPEAVSAEPESRPKPTKRQHLKLRKQRVDQDPTLASLPRPQEEPEAPARTAPKAPKAPPGLDATRGPGAVEAKPFGKAAGPGAPDAAASSPGKPLESKLPAAGDPAEQLFDLGVTLPESSVRHILDVHFGAGEDGRSVFRAEHAGPEALEALLARGLAAAGGLGLTFDRNGRRYTHCRLDTDVGHIWTGKHWEAVDRFVIVTVDRWNRVEGLTEHVVLSAYPCSRNY